MNIKILMRLTLDLIMFVLIMIAFAYQFTGGTVHELIGMTTLVLFVIHGTWNGRWFSNLIKGRFGALGSVSAATNSLLTITALTMIVSGLLNSELLFNLFEFEYSQLPREVHTASAYWFLVIGGIHLGLHWNMINKVTRAPAEVVWSSLSPVVRTVFSRFISISIAIYGVFLSFEHELLSRLTGYLSFGSGSSEAKVLSFILQHAAIAWLYCLLAHLFMQLSGHGCRLSLSGMCARITKRLK